MDGQKIRQKVEAKQSIWEDPTKARVDRDAMGNPHLRSGASKGQAGGQPQPDRAPCQMPEAQQLGARQRGHLGQPMEQAGEGLTGRGAESGRWTLPERSQLSSTMAGVRRPYPDKDSPFTEF